MKEHGAGEPCPLSAPGQAGVRVDRTPWPSQTLCRDWTGGGRRESSVWQLRLRPGDCPLRVWLLLRCVLLSHFLLKSLKS